ncbi:MAG TPA: hypothetical protein V6D08_19315 [Candidatus Obscuribacterales bacterium]
MAGLERAQASKTGAAKIRQFGPGTVAMIMGLIVIGVLAIFNEHKVTIERRVETSAGVQFKRRPSVSDLLSWAQELRLSASQEASLRKLAQEERLRLEPVEARIAAVMKEFDVFAHKNRSGGVGLRDVQVVAAPMSRLSREKREIEQAFAEKGLAVLDAVQRDKTSELWETKLARMGTDKRAAGR